MREIKNEREREKEREKEWERNNVRSPSVVKKIGHKIAINSKEAAISDVHDFVAFENTVKSFEKKIKLKTNFNTN